MHTSEDEPTDGVLRRTVVKAGAELSPTTRSFDSFSDALSESIDSRVYVGNHFRFTLEDSREADEEIGEYVLETHLTPVDSDRPGRGRGRRGDAGDVPAE